MAQRIRSFSILILRMIGSMFMRVSSACAHDLRPPLRRDQSADRVLTAARYGRASGFLDWSCSRTDRCDVDGNKTPAVFDRYNVVNEQELLRAGQRLAEYLGATK